MSFPGKILFEILAQVHFDDSIQILLNNIRNRRKFSTICTEPTEQNETSISETICPTIVVFGKKAFQMLVF